jgi:hypothetical protein
MMIARARTFMFVSSAIERRKGVRTGVERRKVMGVGLSSFLRRSLLRRA